MFEKFREVYKDATKEEMEKIDLSKQENQGLEQISKKIKEKSVEIVGFLF